MNSDDEKNETVKTQRPPPIFSPQRPLIVPPEMPTIHEKLTEEEENKIIVSSTILPFDQMQAVVPGLEKLSMTEITECFIDKLRNPPEKMINQEIQIDCPFSDEEKIMLMLFDKK